MRKTPMEYMMTNVDWQKGEDNRTDRSSNIPHVTHRGVIYIMDYKLKCYKLSDGNTVFDADDVEEFFGQKPAANCLHNNGD